MVTAEEYFGKKAGVVWQALKEGGEMSISNLKLETGFSERDLYSGLAWLGREGKLGISGERAMHYKYSLVE